MNVRTRERRARPARAGSIVIVSAPSGSGKSTLIRRLLASDPGLRFSVSSTTRPPRAGERNGREYFFISAARFRKMAASGEFVEWAEVFGHFYGTSKRQLRAAQAQGKDLLLDIDVEGHRQVRRRLRDAVSVFLLPPSYRELERRLRRRHSDAPEVIARRLADARREMRHWREYDYLVVNSKLPEAVRALRTIVTATRFRRTVQRVVAERISKTFGGKKA
jgi:guanylate kinase